jgi:hypothetical protein
VHRKCLKRVLGARGREPTARRLNGRNKPTVEPDNCYAQILHLSISSLPRA